MARFQRNPAFKQELQAEPPFQKEIGRYTDSVASSIGSAALRFMDTGNYIRRIGVRGHTVELEKHFAHIMEYGSVNNKPQANVRLGVKAAGLRFDGSREPE